MPPESRPENYLRVVYDPAVRPLTDYPARLTRYLAQRFELTPGKTLLDLGCGRGEFLSGFMRCGLNGSGVDAATAARALCPDADIRRADFETLPLPYEENCFDYIFSKSVLEHFYYPEKLVREMHRIIRPGGRVITMVPDWQAVNKTSFYDDYTHRSPFTRISLRRIFLIQGFTNVKVERFRQLPFLWHRPWLLPLSGMLAGLTPTAWGRRFKVIRFSKEVMLLASAIKP